MTTKIVCRLLAADGSMLGWSVHQSLVRGDGCLRANGPVAITARMAGVPAQVSLHWCDINVDVRINVTLAQMAAGDVATIFPDEAPMITVGPLPGPLPAITIGEPVAVVLPVGAMGARG